MRSRLSLLAAVLCIAAASAPEARAAPPASPAVPCAVEKAPPVVMSPVVSLLDVNAFRSIESVSVLRQVAIAADTVPIEPSVADASVAAGAIERLSTNTRHWRPPSYTRAPRVDRRLR